MKSPEAIVHLKWCSGQMHPNHEDGNYGNLNNLSALPYQATIAYDDTSLSVDSTGDEETSLHIHNSKSSFFLTQVNATQFRFCWYYNHVANYSKEYYPSKGVDMAF